MQASPRLRECVRALLARDQLGEQALRLHLHGDELLVEPGEDGSLIQITYVSGHINRWSHGDQAFVALAVWLFVDGQGEWIPYQIQRPSVGTRRFGSVTVDNRQLQVADAANQAALARYCDSWAFHLRAQGWLDQAVQRPYAEPTAIATLQWPEPTVAVPDLATLEAWLWEDGGCEASDGCWVEVDGVCPHGHPAWLRRLGYL